MGTHWNEKIPLKNKEHNLLIDVIVGPDDNTITESHPPRQPGIRPEKRQKIAGNVGKYETANIIVKRCSFTIAY